VRVVIGIVLSTLLTSCAGRSSAAPAAPPAAAPVAPLTCTHRLGSRPVARAAAPLAPSVSTPPSRLIVHAQLPLATLAAELERSIAPRLAEGTVAIGPAGVVRYGVDRGAFSLSIADGQLVVETPLDARAQACSGRRCYADCEPRALLRASIPLWLRPDYRFDRSQVSLEFTNGCKVRALGGLLSVDVTPLLKSAITPQLARVRREIDSRLPDVRADVERGWQQLSTPRALPLGGCVVIEPLGWVQGPVQESRGMAHARFALLARPELRNDCEGAPVEGAPLPPLSADASLPDEDGVTFGMELPLADLALAFKGTTSPAGIGPRYHVTEATIDARGERVGAELALADEVCGSVAIEAQPVFDGEEGIIRLSAATFSDSAENERVRAAGLEPAALARQLAELPRLATPVSLPMLRVAPRALAALYSDPKLALRVRVASMRAAGAAARGTKVVAWVEGRGSLLLELK